MTRYDDLVATAGTADELARGFADKLAETITDEASMHRLWYDLRTQSMFEAGLREAVLEIDHTLELMIWRIVPRTVPMSPPSCGPAQASFPASSSGSRKSELWWPKNDSDRLNRAFVLAIVHRAHLRLFFTLATPRRTHSSSRASQTSQQSLGLTLV